MQKYNLNIPTWMLEKELTILSTLAGLVPANGAILEIGCFLGSSTTALYRGKQDSVSLDVVDTFNAYDIKKFRDMEFGPRKLSDYKDYERINYIVVEQGWRAGFEHCVGEEVYKNLTVHQTTSKEFNKYKNFDLTFIDADHTYELVRDDIIKYTSSEGLVVGDDFTRRWPGVIAAVGLHRINKTLVVFGDTKLWALIPESGYWRDVFKNNNLLFL